MSLFQTRKARERDYVDFVAARQSHLRRVAYAICGDWSLADDLLQEAFVKLYVAWPRVSTDSSEAYCRQILVRANIDDFRRRSRRPQTTELGEQHDRAREPGVALEERSALVEALQTMPEMQRKVVVLRHCLDLSVSETSAALGIAEGTVKSHNARGLAALRELLTTAD